jgi:hypothetical protein
VPTRSFMHVAVLFGLPIGGSSSGQEESHTVLPGFRGYESCSGKPNPTTAFLKSPANVTRVINEAEGTRLARNFASEVFVGRLR